MKTPTLTLFAFDFASNLQILLILTVPKPFKHAKSDTICDRDPKYLICLQFWAARQDHLKMHNMPAFMAEIKSI